MGVPNGVLGDQRLNFVLKGKVEPNPSDCFLQAWSGVPDFVHCHYWLP